MSIYRIATRFSKRLYSTSRSYPLVHADPRHNQQYLIVSPPNRLGRFLHSRNQGIQFSSASFKYSEKTSGTKSTEKMSIQMDFSGDSKQVQKEIENMTNKFLSALAEDDNMKEFSIQNFAKDFFDFADNLSKASSDVKESFSKIDASNGTDSGATTLLKTLLEGVERIVKQFAEFLKFTSFRSLESLENEQFDASKPPGTVDIDVEVGVKSVDGKGAE